MAPWVISHFPKHRCYVEAFGGAGSVLVRKPPSKVEVYNDLSDEIVNLFRVLRHPVQAVELRRLLDLTPWARTEWLECYEETDEPIERARRTVVLAMQGHNPSKALNRRSNGWRSSSSGHHRLPQDFAEHTSALQLITARLKNVLIENRTAQQVCEQHDRPSTLHYLDPPYPGATRSTNDGDYYQHELRGLEEHRELFEWANCLQGFVLISGYDCPEYTEWYQGAGWERVATTSVTGAAGGGPNGGASRAIEVLWLNPRSAAQQKQLKIFQ